MDELKIEHNGECYWAIPYPRNGKWVTVTPEWIHLVLLRRPGEYPVVERSQLQTTPDEMTPMEAVQAHTAIRHKFVSAALKHEGGGDGG